MSKIALETSKDQGNSKKISIILADDHPLLRQALRYILEKQDDFEIVAEAGDGEEAVSLAAEFCPNVLIMDISMPKVNGLEATRQIKERYPSIAVLVLTVHDDNEHVLGILEAGATGYLTKSVFGEEVIYAIRSVVAGETVLSPAVSRQVIKHAGQHIAKPIRLNSGEKLTGRELELLRLVAIGLSNKEVADRLELSLSTVKSYLTEIFAKLGVGSRTEAVTLALRVGIINLYDIK